MKQFRRKLIKFSHYSLCVTIPKALLDHLDLNRGDEIAIELRRGKIVMIPVTPGSGDSSSKDVDWEPLPQIKG